MAEKYRTVVDRQTGELKRIPVGEAGATPIPAGRVPYSSKLPLLDAIKDEEFKGLLKRLLNIYGEVAGLTEEETAQAIMDRLATFALTKDAKDAITAGREWFDRKQGKPMQKQQNINVQASLAELVELSMQSQRIINQ